MSGRITEEFGEPFPTSADSDGVGFGARAAMTAARAATITIPVRIRETFKFAPFTEQPFLV